MTTAEVRRAPGVAVCRSMSQATDFLVIPRISNHPDFIRFHQISQDPVFSLSSKATTMLTPVCDTDYEQYDRPKQNQGLLKVKQSPFTKIIGLTVLELRDPQDHRTHVHRSAARILSIFKARYSSDKQTQHRLVEKHCT